MKLSGKTVVLSVLAVAVATVAIRIAVKPSVPARFVVAHKGPVLRTVLANGRVAGSKVVALSMLKSGIVARLDVREGDTVARGDTLVVLDIQQESNEVVSRRNAVDVARVNVEKLSGPDLKRAQEELAQAQAEQQNAQQRLERLEVLVGEGAVARQEVDNARKEAEVARSRMSVAQTRVSSMGSSELKLVELQLAQATSALRDAQISLARAVLCAPESGRVVRIHVQNGQLVTPGVQVVSFLALDTTTHVELQVDESEIARVRTGQRALVSVPSAPEIVHEALVRDIVPIIDAARGTATVQLSIGDQTANFLPDQTVSAQIVTDTIQGGIVLEQRFVASGATPQNAMVLAKGRAVVREVTTRDAGGGKLLVLSGISEGDTVLFAATLKQGDKVQLMTE